MFLRLLFVLLSALNIAMGAWLWLGQPYPRVDVPGEAGVPELHLLSEMPDSATVPTMTSKAANAPHMAVPTGAMVPASPSYRCMTIGPFATAQDLQSAQRTLTDEVQHMRSRQALLHQTSGWWVYLPAAASRAKALQRARQLEARHIKDYFVVSSGNQANTISLGLFKDPSNAHHRLEEVEAAGFAGRMVERREDVTQYWLDLVSRRTDFSWQNWVHSPGVGSHPMDCF